MSSLPTVSEALLVPELRRGQPEVLTEHAALTDRRVRWVHAAEIPDIAQHLRGGELLLTTGMGLSGATAQQRSYIRGLADRNLAALVIELHTSVPSIPAAVIAAARDARLPLIQLHRPVPFVAVTEAIHRRIVDVQYARLRRANEIDEQLTARFLAGLSAGPVIDELSALLANPVVLTDPSGAVVYFARHAASSDELFAAWERTLRPDSDLGLPPHDMITVEVPSRGLAHQLTVICLDGPMPDEAEPVLRRAAVLVGLALTQARQGDDLLLHQHGGLLSDLLARSIAADEAERRARASGFRIRDRPLLTAVVVLEEMRPTAGRTNHWSAVANAVARALGRPGRDLMLGARSRHELLAVAPILDGQTREKTADVFARAVHLALSGPETNADATIAIGRTASDWPTIAAGLREAERVALERVGTRSDGWVDAVALTIDDLVAAIASSETAQAFAAQRLGVIQARDETSPHKLMPTLATFLETGGNKTLTAHRLSLRRQTLYDRLARIEETLGASLSDPETRHQLWFAVQVLDSLQPPR